MSNPTKLVHIVVSTYQGCIDDVDVFDTTEKAETRKRELLDKYEDVDYEVIIYECEVE